MIPNLRVLIDECNPTAFERFKICNASAACMPHYGCRQTVFKTSVTSGGRATEDTLMSIGFEIRGKKARAATFCEKVNLSSSVFMVVRALSRMRRRAIRYS